MGDEFQLPIIKLGTGVDYDFENDIWRLRVAVPDDLDAVLIGGIALRALLETRSEDDRVLKILIEQHHTRVERYVATAELGKWPDTMGVFPQWKEGKEPK
jgi:hypothetical protein